MPTKRGPLTEADRQRVGMAVHEAGHAAVGALYGATIDRATLTSDGTDGECSFTADGFGSSARAHRSLIAAAGAVAAAVFHHGPRPTLHQIEAHLEGCDREELRLASLSSLQPITEPLTDVLPTVLRCWPASASWPSNCISVTRSATRTSARHWDSPTAAVWAASSWR